MEQNMLPSEDIIHSLQVSLDNKKYKEIIKSEADAEQPENDVAWSEGTTKLLLDKYEQYLTEVGPLKKFKTKKVMWERIASDIKNILGFDKSSIQVENRFKTIMKRKRKAVDSNKRSGEGNTTVQ